VSSIKAADV